MRTPRVEVDVTRQTPDEVRAAIQQAFARENIQVAVESRSVLKAAGLDLRLVVTFLLGVNASGLLYDAEKVILRRGLAAMRSVMDNLNTNGTVMIERPEDYTEYLMPGPGPRGDAALAALEADYEGLTEKGGTRVWMPGEGWIYERELIGRMESHTLSPEAQAIQDEQWVEYWAERGRENTARVEALTMKDRAQADSASTDGGEAPREAAGDDPDDHS